MSNTNKAVYLLERTKDSVSNIIGFYSSEELAITAVKRHVEATIDAEVLKKHADDRTAGIYIQEGFMISKNEVEVDGEVDFEKIEDPDEFSPGDDELDAHLHHPAEDLGDVNDTPSARAHADREGRSRS